MVTIIVLLILAAVAINLTIGNNGIFTRAQNAVEKYEEASINEQNEMNSIVNFMDGLNGKDNSSVLEIGTQVNYDPNGTYLWEEEYYYSYYTTTAEDEKNEYEDVTLDSSKAEYDINKWMVLNIDDDTGEVTLVPSEQTVGKVVLGNAQGYNNAVYLLNKACEMLYGNETKGINARSIKIEDIESYMTDEAISNEDGTGVHDHTNYDGTKYGEQTTNKDKYLRYPIIYAREKLAVINGIENGEGNEELLGISEQDRLIEKTEEGAREGINVGELQAYKTVYYADLNQNMFKTSKNGINYYDLLVPKGENTSYWIASRCVDSFKDSATNFCVNTIIGNSINPLYLISSFNLNGPGELSLFPIITVNMEKIIKNENNEFVIEV